VAVELYEAWNSDTTGPNMPSMVGWLDDVVVDVAADLKNGKCTIYLLDEVAKV
jgi:hypothetical protein